MTENQQPGTDIEVKISSEMLQLFAGMAAGIPEAADDEAYDAILSAVLTADTPDQLNAPWDTNAVEALAGHTLRVDDLTRRPSDFKGGLGMYLTAKGVDQGTGERFVVTTGAIAVVAQFARAFFVSGLPILVQWVVGDPSPRTGRRPQHLNIIALAGTPAAASNAAQRVHGKADDKTPF